MIEIVRSAPDQKAARQRLMDELGTSEEQTDAILKLQLGQLTRLNKGKLQEEKDDLEQSRKEVRIRIMFVSLHFPDSTHRRFAFCPSR